MLRLVTVGGRSGHAISLGDINTTSIKSLIKCMRVLPVDVQIDALDSNLFLKTGKEIGRVFLS